MGGECVTTVDPLVAVLIRLGYLTSNQWSILRIETTCVYPLQMVKIQKKYFLFTSNVPRFVEIRFIIKRDSTRSLLFLTISEWADLTSLVIRKKKITWQSFNLHNVPLQVLDLHQLIPRHKALPVKKFMKIPHFYLIFVYLTFNATFNTVQVISREVALWTEETGTNSWSIYCTINCRPLVLTSRHRVRGLDRWPQRWAVSVLPLYHHGPYSFIFE